MIEQEVKAHYVPEEKQKKEQPRTIASPIINGKKYIGSGEDAITDHEEQHTPA